MTRHQSRNQCVECESWEASHRLLCETCAELPQYREEAAQDELRVLENEEMERHFREHPHG